MWIITAIYHSVLLFWIPKVAMETGVQWGSGESDGYLVLGNTVYTLLVITTCLKVKTAIFLSNIKSFLLQAAIIIDSWNYISHIFIWGSIVFWFIFLVIYSHFWPTIKLVASNMPRMYQLIFSSGAFWFLLFLVPIATLLIDVVVAYTKFTYRPSITDRFVKIGYFLLYNK